MVDYIVAERKDLGKDGLVAIPESIFSKRAREVYDKVGLISGLTNDDFQSHSYWRSFKYIPIVAAGALEEPSEAAQKALKKGLEAICQSHNTKFDQKRLLADQDIKSRILNYEVMFGDLYVVRFKGRDPWEGDLVRCLAFFVSPEDGPITVNGTQVMLGNKPIELPDGALRFAITCSDIKGTLGAFKAGSASIHRKSLKPYTSEGMCGSEHLNGPWIILEDKLDDSKIDLIKSFMRKSD